MSAQSVRQVICVLLVLWGSGCGTAGRRGSSAPPPLPASAGVAAWSGADLEAARVLYVNKCARCHKFYDPAKYDAADWHQWMNKMSRKAKLLPDQEQLLKNYLGLYRSPESASP